MKRKWFVILVVVCVVILAVGLRFGYGEKTTNSGTSVPVLLTPENFASYAEKTSIIKSVPSNGRILIYFGDDAYSVENGMIKREVIENAEIIIHVPGSYLNREWSSLCQLVKTANQNRDLTFESSISKTKLALKYNNLLKYKSCL